jgi:hypothetical protein
MTSVKSIRKRGWSWKAMKEEFEDTKWIIRICKLKDKIYNGQTKKDKQRSKHDT